MEILLKIINKNITKMEKNQVNLLDVIQDLPLPRTFGNYRIEAVKVDKPEIADFCFIWQVSIRGFDVPGVIHYFYFNRYSLCISFCRKYSDRHSCQFWDSIKHSVYTWSYAYNALTRLDLWQ